MGNTMGSRRVCASCRYYALSSREIGPFGQVEWGEGDGGKCMNRRSSTWNSNKQPLMSCNAWAGLGDDIDRLQ